MNFFNGFFLGVAFVTILYFIGFNCEGSNISKKYLIVKEKQFKYDNKIYRVEIDSTKTDSLHNWRNK